MRANLTLLTVSAALVSIFLFSTRAAVALDTTLSGSALVNFVDHPAAEPPYWSFGGFTNTMLLTIPDVIDTAIVPTAIGPDTILWGDAENWIQPTIDMTDFSVGSTGNGTYTALVNNGSATLDILMNAGPYGPSEGDQTFVKVTFSNIQPSGQSVIPGAFTLNSNTVTEKFNVTIPTGANVIQPAPASAPTVENLVVSSGASLIMTDNARVRNTLTNHGSGTFIGTVEGDFINDALSITGNFARINDLTVKGQLQNAGDLLLPGYLTLQAATSNAGTISITTGTLYVAAPFSNNGSISLTGGGAIGGTSIFTNNGSVQWSDGYFLNSLFTNNANLNIDGSGLYRCDGSLTNNGTITQTSTTSPGIAGTLTNSAGALYNITNNSGLTTVFGSGTVINSGMLRKSGGTGTSAIAVPLVNSGTIAVDSGTLAFNNGLSLDPSSTLQFQFRGVSPAIDFGNLYNLYELPLAGTLLVTLDGGFSPVLGDSFDILDLASATGEFLSVELPMLDAGLTWDISQLYTTGIIFVNLSVPGDFNQNGEVEAGDYVVWRKNLETIYTDDDYDTWRANFGESGGEGSSTSPSGFTAVPEPLPSSLLVLFSAVPLRCRARGSATRLA